MKEGLYTSIVLLVLLCFCLTISTAVNGTSTLNPNKSTEKPPAPTSPTVPDSCGAHNGSCDKCVAFPGAKCFYCEKTKICALYPAKEVFPTKYCPLSEARWGVCFLNFEALIISMGVIGGALLIGLLLCIYCCCCRSKSNRAKYAKEDAKFERKKAERKMHHEQKMERDEAEYARKKAERQAKRGQKKAERKAKNDEIRRKYGLMPDNEGSYHKFDENV